MKLMQNAVYEVIICNYLKACPLCWAWEKKKEKIISFLLTYAGRLSCLYNRIHLTVTAGWTWTPVAGYDCDPWCQPDPLLSSVKTWPFLFGPYKSSSSIFISLFSCHVYLWRVRWAASLLSLWRTDRNFRSLSYAALRHTDWRSYTSYLWDFWWTRWDFHQQYYVNFHLYGSSYIRKWTDIWKYVLLYSSSQYIDSSNRQTQQYDETYCTLE